MQVTFSEPLIYKLWDLILETKWAFASFKIFPWLCPFLTIQANESSKTFKFSQIHKICEKSMIQKVQKTLFFNLSSFCLMPSFATGCKVFTPSIISSLFCLYSRNKMCTEHFGLYSFAVKETHIQARLCGGSIGYWFINSLLLFSCCCCYYCHCYYYCYYCYYYYCVYLLTLTFRLFINSCPAQELVLNYLIPDAGHCM